MTKYEEIKKHIKNYPKVWLITGVAGFIGSNLLEELLMMNQKVVGIDNFSNSNIENLKDVKKIVGQKKWKNFKFFEGDLANIKDCKKVLTNDVNIVIHQAARGSIPRSTLDPIRTNKDNVTAFLNLIKLSKDMKIKSFVYASSSSVYGDNKNLPKIENKIGNVLSNYALTKKIKEDYSKLFFKLYNFKTIGLRYFNVFGKRQDPNGDYAAVIPKWVDKTISKKIISIFGDGKTSRDFTPVSNVVQANILAAVNKLPKKNYVYNVGNGSRTSLNKLIFLIFKITKTKRKIIFKPFRPGDIKHSLADIKKIKKDLGYNPDKGFYETLNSTVNWFLSKK
jgi:UDP-N-acetylglucosamine 4-epimerase